MIALNPGTTALVLIDLQNGIFGRKLAPISADELVERGKALARRFREAGAPVVLVNVKPPLAGPERQVDEPTALPKVLPPGFADLVPGLAGPGDILVTKSTWGAFFRTDLDSDLKSAASRPSSSAASPRISASTRRRGKHGISATRLSSRAT